MESMDYIGGDVHRKWIRYGGKDASGRIQARGKIPATRYDLGRRTLRGPWMATWKPTLFTGWIYDPLLAHAVAVKVAHPLMLVAIRGGEKEE